MTGRAATHAYYPLFADLRGRRCLVVGGGPIAQRKASTLLRFGARVTVISPTATPRLVALARQGKLRHVARAFRAADVRGAWLVYAATDDQAVNRLVFRSASRLRIFTNVVDQKPLCSCIAPAIFKRGPLTVAVSTGGASPSMAKKLRHELDRTIGPEYVPMLRLLANLRGIAKRRLPKYQDRKRYFDQLVHGRVFGLTKVGKQGEARRTALTLLEQYAANGQLPHRRALRG